ncbi:omega-amidase NIT2-like, partial [Aphis craccivora]
MLCSENTLKSFPLVKHVKLCHQLPSRIKCTLLVVQSQSYGGNKVYNMCTLCTVWDPNGNLIAKHRKVHLFDVNIPGSTCFKESNAMSPGNTLNTFQLGKFKVGLGICHDMRFSEMAVLC